MKVHIVAFLCLIISSCSVNKQLPLGDLFKNENFTGSTTIYDMKNNKWIYSDKKDSYIQSLPASTFKVVNSLIALEEKVIRADDVMKWDGKDRTFKSKSISSWNSDTDIAGAFKNSTIWFYVELSRRIKRDIYRKYLSEISYGNMNLSEKGFDFWNFGDFAVSPKEQIKFLVNLYKNELPFSKNNMEFVKKIMIQENNEKYTLRGKTGWGIRENLEIGWYIGYLEVQDNVYFFATRIVADSNNLPSDFSSGRKTITLKALKKMKYL